MARTADMGHMRRSGSRLGWACSAFVCLLLAPASASAAQRWATADTGRFWGSKFQIRQPRHAGGMTTLVLRGGDFSVCRRPARRSRGAAVLAKASYIRRDPVRRLWGHDSGGRFRTFGRHSQATVRGTRWLTVDRCDGTLTRVAAGAVAVRDRVRHRTVVVRAGHSYFARARRRPSTGGELRYR
jgi:hypothetical protein